MYSANGSHSEVRELAAQLYRDSYRHLLGIANCQIGDLATLGSLVEALAKHQVEDRSGLSAVAIPTAPRLSESTSTRAPATSAPRSALL
jgi:hypothetical protein